MATPIFTITQTKFLEAPLTLLCLSYPTSNPSENYLSLTSKYVHVSAHLAESSYWLFSASSITQTLRYMLIHDANILTFCSLFHPHASCPHLFVPNLIWFLPEHDQSTKLFCYCQSVYMYPYLMQFLSPHKVDYHIQCPIMSPLEEFPLSTVFQGHPKWGCSAAAVQCQHLQTCQANPLMN